MNTTNPRLLGGGILLGLCSLMLFACESREVKSQKDLNISQASANLHPLGDHLRVVGKDAEGRAVIAQADTIDNALGIPLEKRPKPTVSFEEWQQTRDDLVAASGLADRLEGENKALKDKLAGVIASSGSWWAIVQNSAAAAGALGAIAAIARALNVPGAGLIDLGVRAVFKKGFDKLDGKVAEVEQKNQALTATVVASDVGRAGLAHLDQTLAANPQAQQAVLAVLQGITGRQVGSVEDYFKEVAKRTAVDHGTQADVAGVLSTVRAELPTSGGTPDALRKVLEGMTLASQLALALQAKPTSVTN